MYKRKREKDSTNPNTNPFEVDARIIDRIFLSHGFDRPLIIFILSTNMPTILSYYLHILPGYSTPATRAGLYY